MTFKFVAKNLQTGKTGSLSVAATREAEAREKLRLGGYEVLHLVGVSSGQPSSIKLFAPAGTAGVAARAVAQSQPTRSGLGAFLSNLVVRLESFCYYS